MIAPMPSRTTTETVAHVADLAVGDMKLARVGDHRIAVIRTPSGVHALDNACPHQGYGLVTGSLDGELVTCQWHNWKFRASDGHCLVGEEDVACHAVEIDEAGNVAVTVVEPTPEEAREQLWPSLDRGFDNDYSGQMARDTARLLRAGATAEQIVARQVVRSQAREDYGVGHGLAMATDCLRLSDLYEGDEQTLPVVQALSALSEPTRFRPDSQLAAPDASIDLVEAIETEDLDGAVAATLGRIAEGATADELLPAFAETVGRHHLSYGHGAIYTQKCFELLDRIGWDHAGGVLPHLTISLTYATREDTLPYMRKALRAIDTVDLDALAAAPVDPGWNDDGTLRSALLDGSEAAIESAVAAVHDGAGIPGIIDAVSLAVSERMLRYDPDVEFDASADFGWLDITHGLTYANAARWLWQRVPGPATARLALFTVFLCHDAGRGERWGLYPTDRVVPEPAAGDIQQAIFGGRPDDAVAHALHGDPAEVGEALVRTSLLDRSTSWIVTAHVVKLAQAARVEAAATDSNLPLAAAARFAAAPRLERFVAANVMQALDFIRTGSPPKR